MTRAHYYASTTRNLKDFAQYAVYPLFKTAAFLHYHDKPNGLQKANLVAGLATTGFYGAVTTSFAGFESGMLDHNGRQAVAAEMGKKPEELNFSDYNDSNNIIIRREMNDYRFVQKARYLTDLLPMLPSAVDYMGEIMPEFKKAIEMGRESQSRGMKNPVAIAAGAFGALDGLVYAMKAIYWMYETYAIPKNSHYEIVKLEETVDNVKRKFEANHLIGVVNRAREDRARELVEAGKIKKEDISDYMLNEKVERNAIWPVLEHLATKMNESDTFNMPEMIYLVGNDKINVFVKDEAGKEIKDADGNRVSTPETIRQAIAEIDHMAEVGLKGITEENRQKNLASQPTPVPVPHTFIENVKRNALDLQYNTLSKIFGPQDRAEEYISPRDFGEPHRAVSP